MRWDRIVFMLKLLLIPPAMFLATGLALYGAIAIILERPWMRLAGVAMVLIGIAIWTVCLWSAFGAPRDWLPPGENLDPSRWENR